MKRLIVTVLAIFLGTVVAGVSTACQPKDLGTDDLDRVGLELGKGRVIGIVTDNEEFLAEGETPQTYEGALILVNEAIATGTYKVSEDEPEHTLYVVGKQVAEMESGEDGHWQVDLEAGMYFVRAFYGERSYSGDILVEIREGGVEHLVLELIHGV